MNNKAGYKGFTLIEMLVVISIIGFLSTLAVVSLKNARMKTRDMRRKTDLRQMVKALELYLSDNGNYPSTSDGWWGECDAFGSHPLSGAGGYIPNLAPAYTLSLPLDPLGHNGGGVGSDHCYLYRSDGTNYKILAHITPETGYSASDYFYDPVRPTWAWQISTPGGRDW